MDEQKIRVVTDTIGHKGVTKIEEDVGPVKKVKLVDKMSPTEIRKMLEKSREQAKSD